MEDTFPSECRPILLGNLGQKQLDKLDWQSTNDESEVVRG